MSKLAEATAALRKKDSERSQVLAEIRSLNDLKSKGYLGRLTVQLVRVTGHDAATVATLTYTLSPPESGDEEVSRYPCFCSLENNVKKAPDIMLSMLFFAITIMYRTLRWEFRPINVAC